MDKIRLPIGIDSFEKYVQADGLMRGGIIRKRIVQELTYDELYKSIDNVWSLLYVTGYLILAGEPEDDIYPLRIPNREVMSIFERQVMDM